MFGVSLGGALTDRNHGCRPGCYGVSLGSWQTFSPHLETLDRMSHQGAGKKYHGTALKKNVALCVDHGKPSEKAEWEQIKVKVDFFCSTFFGSKFNSNFS